MIVDKNIHRKEKITKDSLQFIIINKKKKINNNFTRY